MSAPQKCPDCGKLLERVRYEGGCLNEDQFDATRAGDWYCSTCKGTRSRSGYRYFWSRELPADEPAVMGAGVADMPLPTLLDLVLTADEAYALLLDRVGAAEMWGRVTRIGVSPPVREPCRCPACVSCGSAHLRWIAERLARPEGT